MGDTGVAQLHIGAVVHRAVHLRRAAQADMARVVEPHPVLLPVDTPPGHKARCGLHPLHLARQPVFKAVAADAPCPVAAHLSHRAVGVEKQHFVIAAAGGLFHHHQAVRADGQMPLTQRPGHVRPAILRHAVLPVVHDDKIVARAVHLPKFHGQPFLSPPAGGASAPSTCNKRPAAIHTTTTLQLLYHTSAAFTMTFSAKMRHIRVDVHLWNVI